MANLPDVAAVLARLRAGSNKKRDEYLDDLVGMEGTSDMLDKAVAAIVAHMEAHGIQHKAKSHDGTLDARLEAASERLAQVRMKSHTRRFMAALVSSPEFQQVAKSHADNAAFFGVAVKLTGVEQEAVAAILEDKRQEVGVSDEMWAALQSKLDDDAINELLEVALANVTTDGPTNNQLNKKSQADVDPFWGHTLKQRTIVTPTSGYDDFWGASILDGGVEIDRGQS